MKIYEGLENDSFYDLNIILLQKFEISTSNSLDHTWKVSDSSIHLDWEKLQLVARSVGLK